MRGRIQKAVCSIALLLCAPVAAQACSFAPFSEEDNQPVRYYENCRFDGGGRRDLLRGKEAYDLGEGRVAQIFNMSEGSAVLVTDCYSGEALIIWGKPSGPETSCGVPISIEPHIRPDGRFRLNRGRSLSDLLARARWNGFETSLGTAMLNNGERRSDQVDFSCACRLFYPERTKGWNSE